MTVKHEDPNGYETLTLEAMNSQFFIAVNQCGMTNWEELIYRWIKHAEKEWSRFEEDSELQTLNRLQTGQKQVISPPLFDCLMRAEEYRIKTDGRFSPYLLSQMEFHGYNRPFPYITSPTSTSVMPPVNQKKQSPLLFDQQTSTVERLFSERIDLGGIGKGYVVQAAAKWLKHHGAEVGIVDGGGDIAVWSDGKKEWRIGIAHPFDDGKEIAQFLIKNGGIATSNVIHRSWRQGAESKHHLLNGHTGKPVESDIIQATLITKNCLDAEVMAKVCFMEQGPTLHKLLKKIHPMYSLVLVHKSGKITIG